MGSCRAEDLALVLKVPKRWLIIVLLRMVGKTVSRHKRATDLPRGQGNKREVYYYEAYGTKAAPSTSLQSFFGAIIRPVEIDETQDS